MGQLATEMVTHLFLSPHIWQLFVFLFLEIFIDICFINNTNTGYITKQNTGHDNTIQYAADSIYNDHYILILLNIFYIHNINYSYKCLKLDHFLTNLVSLKHLFSCKILYLRLLLYVHILNSSLQNLVFHIKNLVKRSI